MTQHKNQSAIFNPLGVWDKKIVIIWAGWVGSTSAYYIAQMWCNNITIIDYDEVELHNTASQFYKQSDIGKMKVEALKENIRDFTGVEVTSINDKYNIAPYFLFNKDEITITEKHLLNIKYD